MTDIRDKKLKASLIWSDGSLVSWDMANIHVMSHTLHYGLGVFEGIRAYSTYAPT